VQKGEIFGLLGPNGAGKTTTLECLEGLRQADKGCLRVMGVDPIKQQRKLRKLIGVQLQTGSLPGYFSVSEIMRLFCAYHSVNPDFTILERLGLSQQLRTQCHALSTGQQRRLALALAMAHHPPVLFLDEPTAGLDVSTRISLHELMKELREEGTTIIMSTHDMAEAETMADRVAILLHGQLAAIGVPRELTATGDGLTKITVRTAGNSLSQVTFPEVAQQTWQGEYAIYFTSTPGPVVGLIISHIDASVDN
jgi:ABC-2 type transport system ATP-binding protein